ncbi:hypothetical protein PVK06_034676 [Gossypium arboreum]|uniref:UBN2 domain-containing protein n=1 Tax=Gossypium arboreum TaxID=29729 RepID=A0ABR0NET0_GOSAR|nr:hypothetical protein PVK06_034676 [Gossypium arboreum]
MAKLEEGINEMSDCFTHIINGLKALEKIYPNKEMVKKMLNSLPTSWKAKVTTIEESKDFNSLSLDELGSLLTYEMKINHNAQKIKKKLQKKVEVAFKSTTSEKNEDSSNDDEVNMAMFAKKFKKFMKFNKAKIFLRRDIIKGEPSKKENDPIICYECKKLSHIKFDWP